MDDSLPGNRFFARRQDDVRYDRDIGTRATAEFLAALVARRQVDRLIQRHLPEPAIHDC